MSTCQHVNLKQKYSTDTHATHTLHIRIQISKNKTNITCDNLNENTNVRITYQWIGKILKKKRQQLAISDMTSQ